MVISKETVSLRYYELRESIDNHDDALQALASETGHDVHTVESALSDEVGV